MKDLISELNPTNPYLKKKVKDNDGEISEEEGMLYDLLETGFCDGDFTMDTDKYECVIECAKLIIDTKGEDKAVLALADAFGYYATTTELGAHSLTKDHDAVEQLYVANEGFGEALEKMWEAIKSFFRKLWSFVTGNGWNDAAGPESYDKSEKDTAETLKEIEHVRSELTSEQKNRKVKVNLPDEKHFQTIVDSAYEILRNNGDYIKAVLEAGSFDNLLRVHNAEKLKQLKEDLENAVMDRVQIESKLREGPYHEVLDDFNRTLKSHDKWLKSTKPYSNLVKKLTNPSLSLDSFKPKDSSDKELSKKYKAVSEDYLHCFTALRKCMVKTKSYIDRYRKICKSVIKKGKVKQKEEKKD